MARTGAGWIVAAILAVCAVTAQERKPTFEIASVKPQPEPMTARDIAGATPRVQPGGGFHLTHVTVEALIFFAYDLKPPQILAAPDWLRRDRFQIDANARGDVPGDQIKLMVRSLLEDRFKLVTHREQRTMRYEALIRARPDGPLGPSLLSMEECNSTIVNELRRKFPDKYPSPMGPIRGGCSKGVDLLADYLSIDLGTWVMDATGLKGSYYHTISYRSPTSQPAAAAEDPRVPPLPVALEEQLGLKLESHRGPVDVLIIDSVQQPTEN